MVLPSVRIVSAIKAAAEVSWVWWEGKLWVKRKSRDEAICAKTLPKLPPTSPGAIDEGLSPLEAVRELMRSR